MNGLDPQLVQQARLLLARASVIPEGPGADYVPSGARQYTSKPPTGDNWSTYDRFKRMFQNCKTNNDLRRAIERADNELTHRPRPKVETEGQRDQRILAEYEGEADTKVSECEGINLKSVWNLRRRNGRSVKTGLPVEATDMSNATRPERLRRVLELHGEPHNMSARQIALTINVSHPTVLRDLQTVPSEGVLA